MVVHPVVARPGGVGHVLKANPGAVGLHRVPALPIQGNVLDSLPVAHGHVCADTTGATLEPRRGEGVTLSGVNHYAPCDCPWPMIQGGDQDAPGVREPDTHCISPSSCAFTRKFVICVATRAPIKPDSEAGATAAYNHGTVGDVMIRGTTGTYSRLCCNR